MYSIGKDSINIIINTATKSLPRKFSKLWYAEYTEIPNSAKIPIYKSNTSANPFSNKSLIGDEELLDETDTLELKSFFDDRAVFMRSISLKDSSLSSDLPSFDLITYSYASRFAESSLNLRLSSYFNWVNKYSILAFNFLDLHKEGPQAKPLLEGFQQKYNVTNFPYYTFSNEKNLFDYDDPDSGKVVIGSLLQKKVTYSFDRLLEKSEFRVKVPLARGFRADFIIPSVSGDESIFVDVKSYSPPTTIEIDQLGCEVVSRVGDESGDHIVSGRLSTLLASSLKKTSYPPNYNLVLAVNDFPSSENLLRYSAHQDLLNKGVLPKLIIDNKLPNNFCGNLRVYFGFYGKPPADVTLQHFDEVQSFNLSVIKDNFGFNSSYTDDLVKAYKK